MSDASTKPYLIRAIHEWCTDQGYTPYLAVSVTAHTVVPREYVRNGEIVLNVGHLATNKLKLGNELIEFQARFNGSPRDVSVPIEQVTAIYARETGHGMAFEVSKPLGELPELPLPTPAAPPRTLELVNDASSHAVLAPAPTLAPVPQDAPLSGHTAGDTAGDASDTPGDEPGGTTSKGGGKNGKPRPALKRVK